MSLLNENEALILFTTTNNPDWVVSWLVTQDDTAVHAKEFPTPLLKNTLVELQNVLDPSLNPTLKPYPVYTAHKLYQALFGGIEDKLVGKDHLIIVPDRLLQSVSFNSLVTEEPHRSVETLRDHAEVSWLARKYAVSVLPNVASIRALRSISRSNETDIPFIGVGDPVLSTAAEMAGRGPRNVSRGASGLSSLRTLPALPDTADELKKIASILGGSSEFLYLQERASKKLVLRAPLSRARIISFATHGLTVGDLGMEEPALVLTPPEVGSVGDALLTASDVVKFSLGADWIILSACNTSSGDGTSNEALAGLARSFFYAGARTLLVSQWPVVSDAAVLLTTGAVDQLAENPGIGKAEAMRRSMVALMDGEELPYAAHPAVWAPFVVVGEGAPDEAASIR
jgi:CHAT domain-containing protein